MTVLGKGQSFSKEATEQTDVELQMKETSITILCHLTSQLTRLSQKDDGWCCNEVLTSEI
jgi:hypothetical protein